MKLLIFLFLYTTVNFSQDFKLIKDQKSDQLILVGKCSIEEYQDSNFAWWFNYEYKDYKVDTNTVVKFTREICDKRIKIILGTWCSDSQMEVPRFIKILDFIGFPKDSLELINVDRDKVGLKDETDGLDIELVPTIIIYEKGEEIGRIIELPNESLEKDLVDLLKIN